MNLSEYIAGIEKVSGQPVPDGSPRWVKLAERYAETLRAIQERTPNLLEQGIQFPENRVSRALFTAETGIALPKTQRGSLAVLTGYVGAEKVDADRRAKEQAEADRKGEAERKRIGCIVERFRGGATITGAELVDAAHSFGADIHPRTIGVLCRKVSAIKRDGTAAARPGTSLNGNTIWPLIRLVLAGTDEPAADAMPDDTHADDATQAVAESLFRPGGTLFAAAV